MKRSRRFLVLFLKKYEESELMYARINKSTALMSQSPETLTAPTNKDTHKDTHKYAYRDAPKLPLISSYLQQKNYPKVVFLNILGLYLYAAIL